MSTIVKKCPTDGLVYDLAYEGTCASCFGTVKFYCKTHNDWLTDASCPKCNSVTPANPASAGPSIVAVLAVLAICIGGFILSGSFVYRSIRSKPRQPASAVSPLTPRTAPQSAPARMPSGPSVVTLSLAQLLADPEPYIGKLVKMTGNLDSKDPARETFDLRQGDHIVEVFYQDVDPAVKSIVTSVNAGQQLVVTGVVRHDDADNSYSLHARLVELQ